MVGPAMKKSLEVMVALPYAKARMVIIFSVHPQDKESAVYCLDTTKTGASFSCGHLLPTTPRAKET
jgi:hypothetical protein